MLANVLAHVSTYSCAFRVISTLNDLLDQPGARSGSGSLKGMTSRGVSSCMEEKIGWIKEGELPIISPDRIIDFAPTETCT